MGSSGRSLYIGRSFVARFLLEKAVDTFQVRAENEPPPYVDGSSAIAFELLSVLPQLRFN
jgi:hypothetical protein